MDRPPRTRPPATLASLAAELGISRTTVSNAYNRPDQLSPQLRMRVMDTARRLGYPGPDPVARSLRTRKAGAIGLLLTERLSYAFRDPGAVSFLEGLTLECDQARIGLLLVPARPDSDDVLAVSSASVDGFVVYHPSRNRVHYLNHTAAIVLELCTGENDAPEIVHQLQATFELSEPPTTEIEECLTQLYAEGLIC